MIFNFSEEFIKKEIQRTKTPIDPTYNDKPFSNLNFFDFLKESIENDDSDSDFGKILKESFND